jgi:protoporphyrinogen oxidase
LILTLDIVKTGHMVTSTFNKTDEKIAALKAAFQSLNEKFARGVNVQTWVSVNRQVDDLRHHLAAGFRRQEDSISKSPSYLTRK